MTVIAVIKRYFIYYTSDPSEENASITELEAQIATLRIREEEARRISEFVSQQRRALEKERDRLIAQTNPYDRVPSELLIHIFEHFVERDDENNTSAFYFRPFTLSHVCHRWRCVALDTSGLWCAVLMTCHNTEMLLAQLARSKLHQLAIDVRVAPTTTRGEVVTSLWSLAAAATRWRTLTWAPSSHLLTHGFIFILHKLCSLPKLRLLDLAQEGEALHIKEDAQSSVHPDVFPALETLRLRRISPLDFPTCTLPNLRTLHIDFPNNTSRHLRMSNLCAMLSRTPSLSELTLNGSVPLMDIYVDIRPTTLVNPDLPPRARRTPLQICPVALPRLSSFECSFPPPRDLWLFFHFLAVPALRLLELSFNAYTARWLQLYNDQLSEATVNPILGEQPGPLAQLSQLEDLSVECVDIEGLTMALKRLNAPALKSLSLTYLPAEPKPGPLLPQLPRLESMFREPRIPTLTRLSISCFDLDLENTKTMLRYTQSLVHLTLRSCLGAGKVVCALSGGTCADGHVNHTASWICPRLERLTLVHCVDVRFRCLSGVVIARKAGSQMSFDAETIVQCTSASPMRGRRIRPLKKRVAPLANSSACNLQSYVAPEPLSGMPVNGSFVPGWKPHELLKPSRIQSVHVEGCPRISRIEAMSLEEEGWDVPDVLWKP
ncbi:hypothetical protein IEO21_05397 [Rhodonia placenta]|uniref:F-box domain-containing protein n=1 Tax=Rhodonia placenta TaxID=104341 RepID=A0A8H7U248_9APHY|nr:hypothetical protein IEO21_05397 [Postia placenta]